MSFITFSLRSSLSLETFDNVTHFMDTNISRIRGLMREFKSKNIQSQNKMLLWFPSLKFKEKYCDYIAFSIKTKISQAMLK